MSQRLMLTALKSARLNGVPFGIEERKKKKKRNSQSEIEGREGKRKKKKKKKQIKDCTGALGNYLTSIFFMP